MEFIPIAKLVAGLSTMKEVELLLKVGGAALVGSEAFAAYQKNKHLIKRNKLANGELIGKNDILDILGNDGLILSQDIQLKEKYDYEGSIIFGPTGSGKTTSFYIPNLLSPHIRGSIIVPDPKGELFNLTSGYQEKVCGRKVLKFSPLSPSSSEKYNLLSSCRNNEDVKELAENLLFNGSLSIELATGKKANGIEWVQMAGPLFKAALLYAYRLEYPFNNIEFAFQLLITLDDEKLDKLFMDSKNYECITQWNIFKMVAGADRTEGSIKITLATNLQLFTDQRINAVGSESTFDFKTFREKPTILYITYPEHRANYISPFMAPLFTRMLDTFIEQYNKNSLPVHCYFDEFANIGMISNMNTKASTVRSREISLNICLQGLTQLHQVYGKDIGDVIINNLKTKIVLPGLSDIQATNYLSQLCGEKEIETISKSENKTGNSTSYNKTKIRMFSESDLRCLENDKLLLITSNKQPILTTQNIYYKNEKYIANIKNPIEINQQPVKRYDLKDYLEDLKIDLTCSKEQDYDIKSELFK